MNFDILFLIIEIALLLPVILLIWDHIKDDRMLKDQVQEFYFNVENLVYLYYFQGLYKAYFCNYFWRKNRDKIFKGLEFNDIEKKIEHRSKYYKEKVVKNINEWGKYLGMICMGKKEEDPSSFEYFNDTNLILTYDGEVKNNENIPLVEDFLKLEQTDIGWKIRAYLGSLREYWSKYYKKFIFRPTLRYKIKVENMANLFDQYIKRHLKFIESNFELYKSKNLNHEVQKKYERYVNFSSDYIKEEKKKLIGILRLGIDTKVIGRFVK